MHPERTWGAYRWGIGLALLSLLATTAGCGGGSKSAGNPSSPGTGSAVVTIDWPARSGTSSRVIPSATESIVIRIYTDRELPHLRKVLTRPSSAGTVAVRFDGLPFGPVLFVAEAHSDTAGQSQPPLASGAQTVTIGPEAAAQVDITMAATADGTAGTSTGRATVIVSDIPSGASLVTVRVLRNGQVIRPEGEPPAIPRTADLPFSAVPLSLGPLPVGSLLFVATATDPTGAVVARGSKIAEVSAASETTVTVPLVQGSGGTDAGSQQSTTGAAVINVTNVGTGDALLAVDPLPGDRSLADPPPVYVRLQGAFVQNGLPISRVPVLVSGLPPGPWLFVVTTHTGPATTDPVNRVGTVTADIRAGERAELAAPLGSAQSAAPPKQDGELNVRTTNITGRDLRSILVAVFDSTGRVKEQVVDAVPGVNERLLTFSLPGGSYTVVSAAYTRDRATVLQDLANAGTSGIPANPLAIGSTTVRAETAGTVEAQVELRLQGGAAASGSVNLAMVQVPVAAKEVQVGDTDRTTLEITSSIVVRVFSVSDNQELPTLRRVLVPPSAHPGYDDPQPPPAGSSLLVTDPYDHLKPIRLRIDGVPVGPMRFEVMAVANRDGTGPILGSGSAIQEVTPSEEGVTLVTVHVLQHGDLPPDAFVPGTDSTDGDPLNPPPTRARDWRPRFWQVLIGRR